MLEAAAIPPVVLPPRYQLGAPIGRGAFGVVLEGRDLELDREVAIKLVLGTDPQEIQRFETEARKGAAVSHPCLLHILDAGRAQSGEHYLVMERLVGQTLAERLGQGRPLSSAEAGQMLEDLLGALRAMEARRLVHRDIKPTNVFLAELPGGDRVTKLIDFGLAKLLEADRLLTARGMIVGSPGYLAPERYRGDEATPETDLYALGATLFEGLTGRPPFSGESPTVIMAQVMLEPAPHVSSLRPDVDPALAERIAALLDRDPAVRRRAAGSRGASTIHVVVAGDGLPAAKTERPPPPAPGTSEIDVTVSPFAATPTSDVPAELQRAIAERYDIVRRIGAGGMGVVFEARERSLDRPVAIKVLRSSGAVDAEHIERFEREARTAARLGHTNIVSVSDFGTVPGVGAYIVMELLAGESLAQRLERKGALVPVEVKDMALQVLDALAVAHRAGVVHRDLKPHNIHLVPLATGGRLAKLLDFGVVKLRETPGSKKLTERGILVGTPTYMAPEQVQMQEVDARTDVYAMGATMYHALLGALPYDAVGVTATLGAILFGAPVPLAVRMPELDRRLAAVVDRAMARLPGDRYADAGEMRDALVALDPRAATSLGMPPVALPAPDESRSNLVTLPAHGRRVAPIAAPGTSTVAKSNPAPRSVAPAAPGSRGLVAVIVIATLVTVGLVAWGLFVRWRAANTPPDPAPESGAVTLQPPVAPPTPPVTPPIAPPMPRPVDEAPPGSAPPLSGEPAPASGSPSASPRPRRDPRSPETTPAPRATEGVAMDPPDMEAPRPRVPDGFIDPFDE